MSGIDPSKLADMIPDDDYDEIAPAPAAPRSPQVASPAINPMPQIASDAPSPVRRGGRPSTSRAATSAGAPGAAKVIRSMVPSTVRVHVYLRNSSGKLDSVNDYSANDLVGQGTMEAFLRRYVVPDYGFGEYHLYQQDPSKTEEMVPLGSVTILAPRSSKMNGESPAKSAASELMETFNIAQQMAASQQQPPQKSFMDQFAEFLPMAEKMGFVGGQQQQKGGVGMDMMQMFMLMQMMRQPESPRPVGPDPLLLKIIERLDRMDDERMMAAAMTPPPAPPPAPAIDPMTPVINLLMEQQKSNTQLIIETLRGNAKTERDPVRDLSDLSKLIESTRGDSLTIKDVIGLLPQIKDMMGGGNQNHDPFEKTIENFRLFKMMQREFGEAMAPDERDRADASGFWDFAKSFLTSDLAGGLAQAIQAGNAAQQVQTQQAMRRQQVQQVANQVANSRQPHPAQQMPPQQQQQQQQQNRPPQDDGAIIIPESFGAHAAKIAMAATDAERIPAVIMGLRALSVAEDWRPHVSEVLGLTKQNRKEEALEKLENILKGLVDAEALEERPAILALEDFYRHWDIIRQKLSFPSIPEVGRDGRPVVKPGTVAVVEPKNEVPAAAVEVKSEQAEAPKVEVPKAEVPAAPSPVPQRRQKRVEAPVEKAPEDKDQATEKVA